MPDSSEDKALLDQTGSERVLRNAGDSDDGDLLMILVMAVVVLDLDRYDMHGF